MIETLRVEYEKGRADAIAEMQKPLTVDIDSMVEAYEQRLLSQYNGVRNNPIANMCVTGFRRGVENTLEELHLKQSEQILSNSSNNGKNEQKSTDKIEPKFKVGDFVVNDYCMGKVIELTKDAYLLDTGQGIPFSCEHNAHLWTIQDAKDGDVLDANGAPFIYKKHDKDYVYFYCGINLAGEFIEANGIDTWNNNNKVYPATQEQRDLLFQKMKESGYEWDAEKKELKKIDEIEELFRNSDVEVDSNEDGLIAATIKYKNEQKPAWSEEDNNCLSTIIAEFSKCAGKSVSKDEWMRCNDFLNSLKNRVQPQPKQEWSGEDERIRQCLIRDQEKVLDDVRNDKYGHSEIISDLKEMYRERIDWLKSLRPQNMWKPSDEQMRQLNIVSTGKGWFDKRPLREMYEQLKKLKGE